jgi:hypothetical protein
MKKSTDLDGVTPWLSKILLFLKLDLDFLLYAIISSLLLLLVKVSFLSISFSLGGRTNLTGFEFSPYGMKFLTNFLTDYLSPLIPIVFTPVNCWIYLSVEGPGRSLF